MFNLLSNAQNDTTSYNLSRLSADNVIQHVDEGEMTVVSASRSARKIEELPFTIHVVTAEEIIMNGYITLVDVLKSLPNIKTSQPGSGEQGEIFMMRGLTGNQYVKILVDNVPIKPIIILGTSIEAQIPIRQAERIEIIYGPSSSVYGADAAIGVINIITKKAKSNIFANADMVMGPNGYNYTNFHVGGKAGRNKRILEYSFFANYMKVQNMDIFSDTLVFHPLSYLEQHGLQIPLDGQIYLPTQINQSIINQNNIPSDVFFHSAPNYEGSVSMPEINSIPAQSNLFGFSFKYKKWDLSFLNMQRKTHSSIGKSPFFTNTTAISTIFQIIITSSR